MCLVVRAEGYSAQDLTRAGYKIRILDKLAMALAKIASQGYPENRDILRPDRMKRSSRNGFAIFRSR
jgi:hypothetical protein